MKAFQAARNAKAKGSGMTAATGSLWDAIVSATARALASGALVPIATEPHVHVDGGVRFVIRVVANLARKEAERPAVPEPLPAVRSVMSVVKPGWKNPFLPYDPALFVAPIGERHVGLLNKFNVVEHHLLIVTREFESQESPLTLADFAALWTGLAAIDGLGFYNGGLEAGASQPHKHLQLVPLPLAADGPSGVPIEPLLTAARLTAGEVGRSRALPFPHALAWFPGDLHQQPSAAANAFVAYQTLRQMLALGDDPARPFNLLVTRQWMLLVPRRYETFEGLSLNALAFAGALLVRREEEWERLRQMGPMAALRHVAG